MQVLLLLCSEVQHSRRTSRPKYNTPDALRLLSQSLVFPTGPEGDISVCAVSPPGHRVSASFPYCGTSGESQNLHPQMTVTASARTCPKQPQYTHADARGQMSVAPAAATVLAYIVIDGVLHAPPELKERLVTTNLAVIVSSL